MHSNPWLKTLQTQPFPTSPLSFLCFCPYAPTPTTSLCLFLWCCSSERLALIDLTAPLKFDRNSPHSCCPGLIHRPRWLAGWMSRPHVSRCTPKHFSAINHGGRKNMSKLILSEEMFKIVSILFRNNFLPFWRLCYSVTKHCFLFVCTFCL